MKSFFRPSSTISHQIAEFKKVIPSSLPEQLNDDFAAQLQWQSWQSHLAELKEELEFAIDHEMANSDLQISLSGKPVKGHSVCAGFLAGILANAEKLVAALSDLGGKVSDSVLGTGDATFGLVVDGAFESSFGVKMRLSNSDSDEENVAKVVEVADKFCELLDGSTENFKLDAILLDSKVRKSYIALMRCLASDDGKIFVRTRAIRYGVRTSAYQAKQRLDWFAQSSKRESVVDVQGVLTGGNITTGRFEIDAGQQTYRGAVSKRALKQLNNIKLGQVVNAQIKETKASSISHPSATDVKMDKHYLEGIWLVEDSEESE